MFQDVFIQKLLHQFYKPFFFMLETISIYCLFAKKNQLGYHTVHTKKKCILLQQGQGVKSLEVA